jgi:hypothetical protein
VCKGRRVTTLAEAAARASARPWARRSSLALLCRAGRLPEPPVPALRGGGGAAALPGRHVPHAAPPCHP